MVHGILSAVVVIGVVKLAVMFPPVVNDPNGTGLFLSAIGLSAAIGYVLFMEYSSYYPWMDSPPKKNWLLITVTAAIGLFYFINHAVSGNWIFQPQSVNLMYVYFESLFAIPLWISSFMLFRRLGRDFKNRKERLIVERHLAF